MSGNKGVPPTQGRLLHKLPCAAHVQHRSASLEAALIQPPPLLGRLPCALDVGDSRENQQVGTLMRNRNVAYRRERF